MIVGDNVGIGKLIGAVDVVGVGMSVDDVTHRFAALRDEFAHDARLLGKRQRIHQHRAFIGEYHSGRHFGIHAAGEDVHAVRDAISF